MQGYHQCNGQLWSLAGTDAPAGPGQSEEQPAGTDVERCPDAATAAKIADRFRAIREVPFTVAAGLEINVPPPAPDGRSFFAANLVSNQEVEEKASLAQDQVILDPPVILRPASNSKIPPGFVVVNTYRTRGS